MSASNAEASASREKRGADADHGDIAGICRRGQCETVTQIARRGHEISGRFVQNEFRWRLPARLLQPGDFL
jgi:hypothetical protein